MGTWPGWALEQRVEQPPQDPWPGETTLLQLTPLVPMPLEPLRSSAQPARPVRPSDVLEAEAPRRRAGLPWFTLPLLLLLLAPPATALLYAPHRSPTKVTVPLLIGQSKASALASLRMVGLSPELVRVTSQAPAGAVVSQLPSPGSRLPSGATVDLLVSGGSQRPAVLPRLTGVPVRIALRRLRRAHLAVRIRPVNSPLPLGTVVAQSPRAHRHPGEGGRVLLAVSKGRALRAVPSLAHLSAWQAYRLLRRSGFRPLVEEVPSAGRPGLVIAQFPVPRARLARGGEVTIAVARRLRRPRIHARLARAATQSTRASWRAAPRARP